MKLLSLVLIFLLSSAGSTAQTKVSGQVTDTREEGLPMANVSLSGTYDGTSSAMDGTFEFVTTARGSRELIVSFTGYKTFRQQIVLEGIPVFFIVQLQESINTIDAVTITAGSFTAGDQSEKTILRALDIVTTAGATADIAGALNTLPGTQKAGEQGRLFVRGGDGNETRTFIDGLLVLKAYSPSAPDSPSRGRFLPFMFKGTSFSTGGYSAEYGQALSSTLILDSKDKADVARTDLGFLSVGGDAGHTHVWDRGSVAGKIQYTNLRPYFQLINQEIDWKTSPVLFEGQAAFRQQTGKDGMLKFYANFNQSRFLLYNHNIDDYGQKELYDLENQFQYVNASYKNVLHEHWMVRGGLSYTSSQDVVNTGAAATMERETGIHAKTVLEGSLSDNIAIKTGGEVIDRSVDDKNDNETTLDELIASTFVEVDVYAGNRFVTRSGFRLEYNELFNRVSIDPRFSMAYKLSTTGQVSFAYGKFRQSPDDEWLRAHQDLQSEKAEHYILNYQRVENNRTFRLEMYYKRYTDLVKFRNDNRHDLNNSGYGFAKGIELFWRDNQSFRDVDYWISYSLLDTKRNYLGFPSRATPTFASTHNFSLVYKHFIRHLKSQFGFTYAYASGRPYNDPNKSVFNGGTTPFYQDLSFNWSYLAGPAVIFYFSCTNLTGRDNIFGYQYSDDLNSQGLYNRREVSLPAKRFVFAGIFITLSKEKSVNQLPNL